MIVSLELLFLLAVHSVLLLLPMAAAIVLVARRGERRIPVLIVVGLLASGAVGLLAFWAFFADPLLGEAFTVLMPAASAVVVALAARGRWADRSLLRSLAPPLALWVLGTAFLVLLGFAHGGTATPTATAASRFSHALPGDNLFPAFYAEWFYENGHRGVPPVFPVGWISSDRPPLQLGYALSQRPLSPGGTALNYQVLGVALQQLWIVGLWALLAAARVGRRTAALTMVAVLVSGFAIVNGFFVWPKLLPAAMLLAAAALVATPLWDDIRRSLWGAALVAGLCGAAMMGHGSSAFGIVALAIVAGLRGLPSARWLALALAVGIAILAPWTAYQRLQDPPGNRLVKWTLAGVTEIDDRGSVGTILDSYGEAGLGGTLENKRANFEAMAGGRLTWEVIRNSDGPVGVMRGIRFDQFYSLLPCVGLLLLGPVALALRRRRVGRDSPERKFALSCFGVSLVGVIFWGVIVFGSPEDETIVHVGTYMIPILLMAGSVAALRAVWPRFGTWYVAIAAALSLALYAPALDPTPGTSYSWSAIVTSALALAGFVLVALGGAGSDRQAKVAQPAGTALDPVQA